MIKNYRFRLYLFFILISMMFPVNVYAFDDYTESINQYHVLIEVNKKGGAIVTESFLYDFKNNERHGIIRNRKKAKRRRYR